MDHIDELGLRGHMRLRFYDADTGLLVAEREADNVIVTTGLQLVAQAATWVLMQNYNISFGSPFSSSWGNLGPIYGAVGASDQDLSHGRDTSLVEETARVELVSGTTNSNVITLDFLFGTSQGQGTIAEAGVFLQAGLVTTTLTAALVAGTNYTSLSVAPMPSAIKSNNDVQLVIAYDTPNTGATTVTLFSDAAAGATTLQVDQFTPGDSYPVGTTVAYTPGILFDRVVFPVPYNKSSSQVATLELDVALLSV